MPTNFAKTGLLLAVLTGIFVAMGGLVGGQGRHGHRLRHCAGDEPVQLLEVRQDGAAHVRRRGGRCRTRAGNTTASCATLPRRAGLPMPRVYVMHNPQPNAFATGRNPSTPPCAPRPACSKCCRRDEVAGVMAHELGHVQNHDTLTMAVAATIGGAISMLAQYLQFGALFGGNRENNNGVGWIGTLVAMILAPLAAMLVQMAVSRSREYQADRLGAMISGNPLWLASALRKIEGYAHQIPTSRPKPRPPPRTCSSSIR